MDDLQTQFNKCRSRGVPILGIITLDPAATISWIHLITGSEIPIVCWDSVRGLIGTNKMGADILMHISEVESSSELMSATI
ncbi:MAG: hypothetical protein AABY22_26220, partial [Nanoarchaeota archaeon]